MKRAVKRTVIIFIVTAVAILACLGVSIVRTKVYNNTPHHEVFSGEDLFPHDGAEISQKGVFVTMVARSDTWTKLYDFNNEGITENNYQAYTYDFNVTNNTNDEVSEFTFKLTFDHEAYLNSAWNGALEIHQFTPDGEIVDTVPDLRVFDAKNHTLLTVDAEERAMVVMHEGDYFIYTPSSTTNALEMPIAPNAGTCPGCIMYVAIGESIEGSSLEIDYMYHRMYTSDVLFWVAVAGAFVWLVAMIIFIITTLQIKKYNDRHERDNIIINESIDTFTGFIDAKDPYTNGHSKRVAIYTKLIAQELGYTGEDLERIYYIGLLHDCGKIGVPDSILGKPGRLTDEEFEKIKEHTVRGSEILQSFKSLKNADYGALYHHERYDGRGYPEGKAGEDIPLIGRIICVADAFDAMNSNRVYRQKLTREQVISEIEKNKGTQFDPQIADIMLGLIRNGTISTGD